MHPRVSHRSPDLVCAADQTPQGCDLTDHDGKGHKDQEVCKVLWGRSLKRQCRLGGAADSSPGEESLGGRKLVGWWMMFREVQSQESQRAGGGVPGCFSEHVDMRRSFCPP